MRPEHIEIYEALSYDAHTGLVTWRLNRSSNVKAGAVAGWDNGNGYRRIEIKGKRVYSHHVAWLFMTGEWPELEVDHINGDPSDNRPQNLRAANRFENTRNSSVRSHNQSGLKGAKYDRRHNIWIARITVDKKTTYLGRFRDAASAHVAYCEAAVRMHGEFARFA